jgi:DUF2971 family protein
MSKDLFKFCTGPGGIAILEGNAMFITSALDFNDPFEMRPAWTDAHQARYRKNEERRNKLMFGAPLFVALKGGKMARAGTMPPIPLEPQVDVGSQRGIADMHNERVFLILHKELRVLCLVSQLFDLGAGGGESNEQATLMWSHYADQFQGICLALDPTRFNNGIEQGGHRVIYDQERKHLPVGFYDSFLALDAERSGLPGRQEDVESGLLLTPQELASLSKKRFINLLTHKSPAWAYEREVRMIYEMGTVLRSPDYCSLRFACETCKQKGIPAEKCENQWCRDAIRIPAEAISAVIFGMDCMLSTVRKVFSILDAPRYRHVEVYWSCLHSSRYAVQYVKGEHSYIESLHEHRTRQIAKAKKHVRHDANGLRILPSPKGVNYDPSQLPPT